MERIFFYPLSWENEKKELTYITKNSKNKIKVQCILIIVSPKFGLAFV